MLSNLYESYDLKGFFNTLAIIFGILAPVCAAIAWYLPKNEEVKEKRRLVEMNQPFNDSIGIKTVIVPFENFEINPANNIAEKVYRKLIRFKNENYLKDVVFKYFDDAATLKKLEYDYEQLRNKLKADNVISGKYERKYDNKNSYAEITFSVLSNNQKIEIKKEYEYQNFFKELEKGTFTEDYEAFVYLTAGYLHPIESNNFSDLEWYLLYELVKKELNQNEWYDVADIIGEMGMELNSIHKVFPLETISNDENYGLIETKPLFSRFHKLGEEFLKHLKYKGESVTVVKVNENVVEFNQDMKESGSQVYVSGYDISNKDGEIIDRVFLSEKSFESVLKAPRGFDFNYSFPFKIQNINKINSNN